MDTGMSGQKEPWNRSLAPGHAQPQVTLEYPGQRRRFQRTQNESHIFCTSRLTVTDSPKLRKSLLESGEVPPHSQESRVSSRLLGQGVQDGRHDPMVCCLGDPPRCSRRAGLTVLPWVESHLLLAVWLWENWLDVPHSAPRFLELSRVGLQCGGVAPTFFHHLPSSWT